MTDANVPPYREGEPSSSLLVRVRTRDADAWGRLVQLYTPLVCHWCQRAGLQPADVQDVGQEVFQAVWRTIRMFRRHHPTDSFRGWLRTILRSKVADFYRRRQMRAEVLGDSDALTQAYEMPAPAWDETDAATDQTETSLLYQRAVELIRAVFTEKTWLAFQAYVLEGREPVQVAAELEMSVAAVYTAKSRVLKRLHDEFADLLEP